MDYKKLIKSRELRVKIMQFLSIVPDPWMVKLQYRIKTGRKLNLKNPQRFTEKLQWYKLYYRDPVMKRCVDKYEVREYLKERGFADILNECYGVYDTPEDIDLNQLPKSFVLKDTLGGGGNAVIIVPDKEKLDWPQTLTRMQKWVNEPINKKHPGREWVYDGQKHRIIVEKFLPSNPETGGLIEYKFFCFHGNVNFLHVVADKTIGKIAGIGIFDKNFLKLSVVRTDENPLKREVQKPENFEKLKLLAEEISKPFPEARIDFYNVKGRIIFGEITFFGGSGYMPYEPDSFDFEIGREFDIKSM